MNTKVAVIGYGSMGKMLEQKILYEENLSVSNRTIEKINLLKEKYSKIGI